MPDRGTDELIDRVASILGKKVPGEALSNEDKEVIFKNVDLVLKEISEIVVIDRRRIPERLFLTVARLITVHSASDFSSAPLDLEAIYQLETRLRRLVGLNFTYVPVRVDYF